MVGFVIFAIFGLFRNLNEYSYIMIITESLGWIENELFVVFFREFRKCG